MSNITERVVSVFAKQFDLCRSEAVSNAISGNGGHEIRRTLDNFDKIMSEEGKTSFTMADLRKANNMVYTSFGAASVVVG